METTSSIPTLRPLRLGELLDQAVRIYRRNFLTFVGIVALGYIPYALIQVVSSVLSISSLSFVQSSTPEKLFTSPAYWFSILGGLFASVIYAVFVLGLGTAALTNAVSRSYMGQKTSILEAYQQLGASSFKLLATLVLFGLLFVAAFLWTIVPCVGWLTGLGLLVFLGGVVGPLIPAVVVIEKPDGFSSAISRAWNLARRRFWWLLGFAIVFYLFNALVVTGPTALISYLTGLGLGKSVPIITASVLSTIISSVAGALVHLLVLPIQLTAWTLVYFDLRVRTEGFDLALLALTPGPVPALSGSVPVSASDEAVIELSSVPTAAPEQKWLTGDDIGKFVIITLVGGGIYALLIGLLALIGVGVSSLVGGL